MANATSRVQSSTTPWGDDKIKRVPAASAVTYYSGAMIAVNAAGNAVKCDDTAGLTFDGINANTARLQINSDDTTATMALDHSKQITVERPFRFQMAIASAADTDIGSPVYALYDNEVALTGLSNSILVGWIDQVITSTYVSIKPAYAPFNNTVVSDNTLTFAGATTANTIVVPDNLADGLSVVEGANKYITFVTTNSSEQVLLSKKASLLDALDLLFGTGLDAAIRWSTGDASNHSLVVALGDSNQALHVTDLGAVATDWNVSADTHPTVYVHSNTTPATDYMTFGAHDGTTGHINVAGGTTLSLDIAGTAEVTMTATGLEVADGNRLFVGVAAVPGTQAGANWIGLEDSTTDPTGTLTNALALYTPDAGDSLDFLHADGTTDSLGT